MIGDKGFLQILYHIQWSGKIWRVWACTENEAISAAINASGHPFKSKSWITTPYNAVASHQARLAERPKAEVIIEEVE